MREEFHGWYPRSTKALKKLWSDAIFVPDANILLHCLRHQSHVREQLLEIFEKLTESLWIPYQVGLEFQRNRLDVETAALDAYDRLHKEMQTVVAQGTDRLRQLRAHPMIDNDAEVAELNKYFDAFTARLNAARKAHPTEDLEQAVERVGALFKGRIGAAWSQEALAGLKKEGEDRYARKAPPGYMDARKDADPMAKFGDLIIWKDMIKKAKEEGRPIIFISDDAKEDWWREYRGRKLGVRPELIEEFKRESGQDFHMYEFGQFLRVAAEQRSDIQPDKVELVEKSLQDDEQARRAIEFNAEHQALKVRLLDLEAERTQLITHLSGVPVMGEPVDDAPMDRGTIRARLVRLQEEIAALYLQLRWADDAGERSAPLSET